jgi:hypothetical protein
MSEEDSLSQIKFVEDGHFSEDELEQESDPNQPRITTKFDRNEFLLDEGNTKAYSYFPKVTNKDTFNFYAMHVIDDTKVYPLLANKKTFFSEKANMALFIKLLHGNFSSTIKFVNQIVKDFPDCPRP